MKAYQWSSRSLLHATWQAKGQSLDGAIKEEKDLYFGIVHATVVDVDEKKPKEEQAVLRYVVPLGVSPQE